MTVLRSRVVVACPKTTPHKPKSWRSKLEPSTPAQTHESSSSPSLPSPPPSSSHPQNPNPNPDSNPKLGSGSVVVRRRSLRLASNCPDSDQSQTLAPENRRAAARDDGTCSMAEKGEVGFDLFGKRVTAVVGVQGETEVPEMGFEEGERCSSELRLSLDLGSGRANGGEEGKKKRKLEIDINFPACEFEGGDGGSEGFLSLRSGKRVAKRGVDGGSSNGGLVIDLDSDDGNGGSVKSKGKGKLGETGSGFDGVDVVELLDSEEEKAERPSENENAIESSSRPRGERKSSDASENFLSLRLGSNKNGIDAGRRRYSGEEKGKGKLVEEAVVRRWRYSGEEKGKGKLVEEAVVVPNENVGVELGVKPEVVSPVDNVVPGNVVLHEERQSNNTDGTENVSRGSNQYMERFRDIAKRSASRFAHFASEEEEENHLNPQVDVALDIEDWPGPFSTAMKIIKDRAAKNVPSKDKAKPPVVNWVPKKPQDRPFSKNLIPSLQDLCLLVLAKNADAIVSLDHVADALRHRLSQLLCDSRKMNSHFFGLLFQGSPTEVRLRDCSWMTEEQFTESFQQCDTSNLTVLQLDQCGRCMPDYILKSTLACSSNCLPALVTLSLSGACRLSDVGLSALVSSAPALRSLNLSQCSLLTSSSISTLADSLGSVLKELYLTDCQGIDVMLILPALKKLEHLEVLWLSGLESVCDDFIKEFITARGHNLKELVLSDCVKLTDSSVKVIAENCSGLCALDLVNLYKLTDCSLGYLANGCRAIHTLKFCRNLFSDEAIAAFLETSGECLIELSLNNIKKVGHNTAISLAKRSRKLHTLDLSWCRVLTDETLGLIVDSCLSLRILKLFGCTQITNTFLDGHSNPEVRIIGLKVSPILEDVKVPDPHEGPLRYSSVY